MLNKDERSYKDFNNNKIRNKNNSHNPISKSENNNINHNDLISSENREDKKRYSI